MEDEYDEVMGCGAPPPPLNGAELHPLGLLRRRAMTAPLENSFDRSDLPPAPALQVGRSLGALFEGESLEDTLAIFEEMVRPPHPPHQDFSEGAEQGGRNRQGGPIRSRF